MLIIIIKIAASLELCYRKRVKIIILDYHLNPYNEASEIQAAGATLCFPVLMYFPEDASWKSKLSSGREHRGSAQCSHAWRVSPSFASNAKLVAIGPFAGEVPHSAFWLKFIPSRAGALMNSKKAGCKAGVAAAALHSTN